MTAYLLLLGLIAAERVIELAISRRNVAWALERGGIEGAPMAGVPRFVPRDGGRGAKS